jgi:hypothetical protein
LYDPRYVYQYENTQVHHSIPIIERPDLKLSNDNLITLCSEHHYMAETHQIPLQEIQRIIKEQENICG